MSTPQENAALASIADAAQRYVDHVRPESGEDLWAMNITSWMGERMPYVIGRLTRAEQKLARLTEQSDLWHRRDLDTMTAMAGIHGELHGVPLPEVGQWDRDRAAEKAAREQAAAAPEPERTDYRAYFGTVPLGLYSNREAARAHCLADAKNHGDDISHPGWWPQDEEDPDGSEECLVLHAPPNPDDDLLTDYSVMPLTVAAAYDPDAEG